LEQATAARDVARLAGDSYAEAHALYHIGRLRYVQEDLGGAAACLEASLALIPETGPTDTALYAMGTLAATQIRRGKHDDVPGLLLDAFRLRQQAGFTVGLGYWLESVFLLAEHAGMHAFAARYYGYFITIWTGLGSPPTWPDQDVKDAIARIRLALGEEAFDREYSAGLGLTEEHAFALGLELVESVAAGNPGCNDLR
jgi:hypothetical protein